MKNTKQEELEETEERSGLVVRPPIRGEIQDEGRLNVTWPR